MTMQLIQHQELGSAQASITFSSIPQTYTDLVLMVSGRFTTGTGGDLKIEFNGSTTGYTHRQLFGNGSSASSSSGSGGYAGRVNPSNSTANTFGNVQVYIPNFTSGNAKSWSVDTVDENNSAFASQNIIAGLWTGTAAITSLVISDFGGSLSLAQFTSATLYGILKGSDGVTTVS
jgi:hypothetical protein